MPQDIFKTWEDRRNKTSDRVRLLKVIQDALALHPDWIWEKRYPVDLIGELAQQGDEFADQVYWELVRCGFLQFRNIDEDWGKTWRDSIPRAEFSPRARAFMEWLKSR